MCPVIHDSVTSKITWTSLQTQIPQKTCPYTPISKLLLASTLLPGVGLCGETMPERLWVGLLSRPKDGWKDFLLFNSFMHTWVNPVCLCLPLLFLFFLFLVPFFPYTEMPTLLPRFSLSSEVAIAPSDQSCYKGGLFPRSGHFLRHCIALRTRAYFALQEWQNNDKVHGAGNKIILMWAIGFFFFLALISFSELPLKLGTSCGLSPFRDPS